MPNFSMTIFTFAWWWGLQCGGPLCARAQRTLDNPALSGTGLQGIVVVEVVVVIG